MPQRSLQTLGEAQLSALLGELAQEARAFRFEVAPNPVVGAAVIANGAVVARGYHRVWGERHAEVEALESAEKSGVPASDWDTLVVTLEPCSSHGKTPPCVERILKSGVKRVVVGELDPDRRHQGHGLRILQEHGVKVELFEGLAPLASVAPYFLEWSSAERLRRPRPWTIAKWAQTRSGQLMPPQGIGGGRWISGPDALREVQLLRGRSGAIVTGVGTVLADDPRFTVRPPGDLEHPPLRIVLDSRLRTPPHATLLRPASALDPAIERGGAVHILCVAGPDPLRHRALLDTGAEVHELHVATDDGVQLRDVQQWLWNRGVQRVLLEAGPRLLSHYLEAGFVDQLRVYTGAVNGGRGPTMADWLQRLKLIERLDRECTSDAVLEAFVQPLPARRSR